LAEILEQVEAVGGLAVRLPMLCAGDRELGIAA
jgi:hypothetical protein